MPGKIKILQVATRTPSIGFDLCKEISKAYSTSRYEVTTVFLRGDATPERTAEYHGHVIFYELKSTHAFWKLRAFNRLLNMARREKFDIALCHHYKPTAMIDKVNKLIPIPQLFSINHNTDNYKKFGRRVLLRYIFSKRWQLIAASDYIKRDILSRKPQFNSERVFTIYNAIDTDRLDQHYLPREQARQFFNLPDTNFVFGTIGRLCNAKGHRYLIDSFKQLQDSHPQTKLIIIGWGYLEKQLKQQVQDGGLEDKVLFTGKLDDADRYMLAFDTFVFPSVDEGFGLALTEAMGAKIPVITSDCGALPEVVGDTGVCVPARDSQALTQAMQQCINASAEQRSEMGQQVYERLMENFSLSKYHAHFNRLVDPNLIAE